MRFSQLEYFQAVCRYNSVTLAAEMMHVTQPSISSAIKELETTFGVPLFSRYNRQITLTDEGKLFLNYVNDILARVHNAEKLMYSLGSVTQPVHVGIPSVIGTFIFPLILKGFYKKNPDISINMHEYSTLVIRQLIEDDTLDFAIVIADSRLDHAFNSFQILSTEMVFCVDSNHPLANYSSVSLEQLKTQNLIMLGEDSYQNTLFQKHFRDFDIRSRVILYSSQLYTIHQFLLEQSCGACLIREAASLDRRFINIPFSPTFPIFINLIWKKKHHFNSSALSFWDYIESHPVKEAGLQK